MAPELRALVTIGVLGAFTTFSTFSYEVVEEEDKIQAILPELEDIIGGGLVTLEKARVILYRPGENET